MPLLYSAPSSRIFIDFRNPLIVSRVHSCNELTSVSAIYSYYSGELEDYIEETDNRRELLEGDESIVVLKPYKARPRLLYYYNDIQSDEHDWKNEIIAKWYEKEIVYLEE